MSCVAPLGPVYQAGTLSGNPIAMAAGLATLKTLRDNSNIYRDINYLRGARGDVRGEGRPRLRTGHRVALDGVLHEGAGVQLRGREKSDTARYARFFNGMLAHGVLMAPSQFEAMFLSAAHTGEDVEYFLDAAKATIETEGF